MADNNGNPHDRTVTIEAFPDPGEEHGIGFNMYDDLYDPDTPTDTLRFSKGDEKMKKNDFHRITFVLKNTKGTDLKFAPDRKDALWVAEGPGGKKPPCPKKRPPPGPTSMRAKRVEDYELVAHNNNNECQEFTFVVNFVAATDVTGATLIPLDPTGTNQNGGEDFAAANYSTGTVVGVIAGIALLAAAAWILLD